MTGAPAIRLPIDEVAGLPLHPLVVHAAVVLIPLAALGLIVMATSGARSQRYSPLVVFVAAAGCGAAFVAEWTGQALRESIAVAPRSDHFEYGEWLPWVSVGLLVFVVVLAAMDRKGGGRRSMAGTLVALVALLVALIAVGATIVVGHTGAELVWG